MKALLRILFFAALAALVFVSGLLIAGPGPGASALPSEDVDANGFVVLMRSLDLLGAEVKGGSDEPLAARQLFILPQALEGPISESLGAEQGESQPANTSDSVGGPLSDRLWVLLDELKQESILVFIGDHDLSLLEDFGARIEDGAFVDLDVSSRILETDDQNRPVLVAIELWFDVEMVHTLIFASQRAAFTNATLAGKLGKERFFALASQLELSQRVVVMEKPYARLGFASDESFENLAPQLGLVFVHAAVLVLMYAWLSATRFGSLRRQRPPSPRSLLDHLQGVGSFFKRRKPWRFAEELDAAYFRLRLSRFTNPELGELAKASQGDWVAQRLHRAEIGALWQAQSDIRKDFLNRQYQRSTILRWIKERHDA